MINCPLWFSLLLVMGTLCSCSKKQPQPLDLSLHYKEIYSSVSIPGGIVGEQVYDGVPLLVKGRGSLFGSQEAENAGKSRADYPDILGVKVGRTFDELHLLHSTRWPDVEGTTIVRVRLNYADGSKRELDIGYGVHVRDWQRLQTEEREAVTDPQSKVVWRSVGTAKFKSSQRMFKSVLTNPLPNRRVVSIDFVSAEQIASYNLYAATVVDSDSSRPVTSPAPLDRPEWDFNGNLHVRILDQQGNPVSGVLIDTSLSVPETGWATSGAPLYTSAHGTAVVKYPKDRTNCILLRVEKKGWQTQSQRVDLPTDATADQGVEHTFRLTTAP